jgi:predicted RNA-binding Zn-ribbon protein involved in translation (DUF1610 family)
MRNCPQCGHSFPLWRSSLKVVRHVYSCPGCSAYLEWKVDLRGEVQRMKTCPHCATKVSIWRHFWGQEIPVYQCPSCSTPLVENVKQKVWVNHCLSLLWAVSLSLALTGGHWLMYFLLFFTLLGIKTWVDWFFVAGTKWKTLES